MVDKTAFDQLTVQKYLLLNSLKRKMSAFLFEMEEAFYEFEILKKTVELKHEVCAITIN